MNVKLAEAELLRVNNFDLIRFAAALLVAFNHARHHLEVEGFEVIVGFLTLFPGVPMFFFISGFLISRSYENAPGLADYTLNRLLRIYPALIACTCLAFVSVWLTGYLGKSNATPAGVVGWLLGQVSFLQFYNPSFMRDFGTGVLNGSLWTITVELQFYLLVPPLYALMSRSRLSSDVVLVSLVLVFAVINAAFNAIDTHHDHLLYKLANVSFAPWFYMFLLGVLAQRHFTELHRLLSGRFVPILLAYVGLALATRELLGWRTNNNISAILYLVLCPLLLAAAYSAPTLARRILRGNDISYGLYIYHLPVINLMLFYGAAYTWANVGWVLMASIALAAVSWFVFERPALLLKRHPLLGRRPPVSAPAQSPSG